MKTTDMSIFAQLMDKNSRIEVTQELFDLLLARFDLANIDLDKELIKINERKSSLSRSRRLAVPEFLKLRDFLARKNQAASTVLNYSNNNQNQNDSMISNQITF